MNVVVALYFFEVNVVVRLLIELSTLGVGIFGIYAQAMIYRIKARPSWNRVTTNLKFFGVGYVGIFLLALVVTFMGYESVALPLVSLGMVGALAQMFFTYEDLRTLEARGDNEYQLSRTARLYDEHFLKLKQFRYMSIFIAGLFLPLIVNVLLSASSLGAAGAVLSIAFILMLLSELSDRFLFYSTVVPLGMAGGFFVGKQR
jgi:DMSO reductase anchor subunit